MEYIYADREQRGDGFERIWSGSKGQTAYEGGEMGLLLI